MPSPPFRCKKFLVNQEGAAHAVGTDSILLGSWVDVQHTGRALDIGTGTGIIAMMLAQRLSAIRTNYAVDAVEIHGPSAQCARLNFSQTPWNHHLHLSECPVQSFSGEQQYDLIVSNPPFFTETITAPDEARRNARSTQTLTISDLLAAMERLLLPTGKCCLIMPVQEGKRLYEIAATIGLYLTKSTTITTKSGKKPERLLLQLEKKPGHFERDELLLLDDNNQATAKYRKLTGNFYLEY